MSSRVRSFCNGDLFIFGMEALRNSFVVKKKLGDHSYLDQVLPNLARMLITQRPT